MYAYLERENQNKKECSYVGLDFSAIKNTLVIKRIKGFYKVTEQRIPISEIERLVFDENFGADRISFVYKDTYYSFYECGKGVIDYLQKGLLLV